MSSPQLAGDAAAKPSIEPSSKPSTGVSSHSLTVHTSIDLKTPCHMCVRGSSVSSAFCITGHKSFVTTTPHQVTKSISVYQGCESWDCSFNVCHRFGGTHFEKKKYFQSGNFCHLIWVFWFFTFIYCTAKFNSTYIYQFMLLDILVFFTSLTAADFTWTLGGAFTTTARNHLYLCFINSCRSSCSEDNLWSPLLLLVFSLKLCLGRWL